LNNRLFNRLNVCIHDTTVCSRLRRVNKHSTGCSTGCSTVLTTGCIVEMGYKNSRCPLRDLPLRCDHSDKRPLSTPFPLHWPSYNGRWSIKICSYGTVNTCQLLLVLHAFNGLFFRTTWVNRHQKDKPFWILLEQKMMGWQWHQLDHMQIICTSLQTKPHRHFNPFLQAGCFPDAKPTVSKHWRH